MDMNEQIMQNLAHSNFHNSNINNSNFNSPNFNNPNNHSGNTFVNHHKFRYLQKTPKLYFSQRSIDFGKIEIAKPNTVAIEIENISQVRIKFRINQNNSKNSTQTPQNNKNINDSSNLNYYYFDGESTVKRVTSEDYITVWSGSYTDVKTLDPGQSILVFVTLCVDETTAKRLHSRRLSDNVTFRLLDGTSECVQILAELDRGDVGGARGLKGDAGFKVRKVRRESRLMKVFKKLLN